MPADQPTILATSGGAVAADRILEDVPSNHMSTFLPDYEPTVDATTRSAAAAVLACLRR